MKIREVAHIVQPDTYEASMALNQLLRIGKHSIKLHNMIDDAQEMESWVAKKIDLAGDYVKKVYNYTQGEKAGFYESKEEIGDYAKEKKTGKMVRIVDFEDGIYTISYGEDKGENNVEAKDLEFMDNTGADQEEISKFDEDKDFDFENSNQYADNVEKYGDVDKTPLTPQERQQFKKWLNDTANNYFSRALEGIEEIGDDPDNFNDEQKKLIPKIKAYLKQSHSKRDLEGFVDDVLDVEKKFGDEDLLMNDNGYTQAKDFSQQALNYMSGLTKLSSQDYTVKTIRGVLDYIDDDPHISSAMLVFQKDFEGTPLQRKVSRVEASESVSEDAGEGHMSKSTLYHTAKYAIALMQMIKKGDDLEGWVQSKLNKAADYLQGVYNYEEYQKLNPYREDIDENTLDKHSEILKKNIDEILSKATKLDDIDTKPGMMRILNKRVNEFEKKMAKEYKMPKKPKTMQDYRDMMKAIQDIETMPDIMKDPEMRAKVKQRKMQLRKDMPVLDKEFDNQPRYPGQRMDVGEKHGGEHSTSGRSMTKGEMSKREKIVKGMKKDKAGFKKRYGKDADAVMYATATKQAMGEDKYEFRGNPFPILGKAESYLNFGADLARAVVANDQSAKAKAETYLDRVPSFVNTEMKEIFPKTESGIMYRAGVKKYGKKGMTAIQSAAGKGASHQEIGKIKDRYLKDDELDEGLKDYLKRLAAAGVIVGAMAGAGSIENMLDNSVPAMQAMNKAYDMAVDAGNEELAKMIKNDISAVKVRLSSGKDLNFVKSMQDKYIKFMPTENIAYESKLTVMLNQRLK